MRTLKNIWKDDSGATAIEYGLIAALISVAAVAVMDTAGVSLKSAWTAIDTGMKKGSGG